MDNLIANIERIPLSGEDLQMQSQKLSNFKTTFMQYNDLAKVESIEQLFGLVGKQSKFNSIYILLNVLTSTGVQAVGHWILLSITDDEEIQYFDPYGLSYTEVLKVAGQSRDHFGRLFSGYKINENRIRYQEVRENQNECGRHCVVRGALFYFMTNEEYDRLVIKPVTRGANSVMSADIFVTLLTAFLAKSDQVVNEFFKERTFNRNTGITVMKMANMMAGSAGRII